VAVDLERPAIHDKKSKGFGADHVEKGDCLSSPRFIF
jgi:hypothetical protein